MNAGVSVHPISEVLEYMLFLHYCNLHYMSGLD